MALSDEQLARSKNLTVEQVRRLRRSRGTTNETLVALSEGAVRRALRRLDYPDLPNARRAYRLKQERGDDGTVPVHARGRAVERLRAVLDGEDTGPVPRTAGVPTGESPHGRGHGPTPTAGMALAHWEWLGPGNIGGRTRGMVVHPGQPEKMWAASVGGGVWHTEDAGKQWAPVDDFLGNLACSSLAMDPSDPDTIYAGTGEGFSNLDALRGNGVFRTTDGVTWKPIAATQTEDFQAVTRIAVSRTGEVVLAATVRGLFRSGDRAKTWTRVLNVPLGVVLFDPGDDDRAVAGALVTGEAFASQDGGRTWRLARHATGQWSGRVELAYAARDPAVVYASVQMTSGRVWRSADGGLTYKVTRTRDRDGNIADYLGDQGWYGNAVWAGDPDDENLVLLGGINLWRSEDGGETLSEISTWFDPRSVHADHHAIVGHPDYGTHNRTVYFGNDGGVFMAADLRKVGTEPKPPFVKGWTELDNNYGVTQFYGGAGQTATGRIIGGAQDNGTLCFDPDRGTEDWRQIFGGDGGWCAADPSDPDVFYGEYVFLNIHRNTDGGTSDDVNGDRYITGQFFNDTIQEMDWKPVPFSIPDAKSQNALFIAPFLLDPNVPGRMLAGGLSLWRTDDAKAENTPVSGPRWHQVKPSAGSLVSAIAVSPTESDVIWVGHEDGKVFRTVNGTAATPAWGRVGVSGQQPLRPQRYCTSIAAHPTQPDTAYVTFGGFAPDNLWVTHDGGGSWQDLSGRLPDVPLRSLAFHPQQPDFVYCGTEIGLFASEDAGLNWSPTNEGPTNCSVDQLFWMDRTLVCATHGRGMFRIDLSNPHG
ncbi:WD40/YVTN/BNR-like repeat-containing protein [Streptomyces capoamus]|uniref:WD40/YVTN/BNR-like repeat-containing protein n=1 Tax=Streptomyces capoamus TaxID=68183 RepID=UPI00339355B7